MQKRAALAEEQDELVMDPQHGRFVFSSEEFERIMKRYTNFTFRYRIINGLVHHAQNENKSSTLFLHWTDSQKHLHPLKVTLTHDYYLDSGFSRFLSVENLSKFTTRQFNYKIKSTQPCYRFDVHLNQHEERAGITEALLLTLWFTLDGEIGELRQIAPSRGFSANEVMSVYRYFADFLQIKNMLVCDDSELNAAPDASIPLRVIPAIATGTTWLQKNIPGLRLFEGSDIPIGNFNMLRQNNIKRMQSLQEVQLLTLQKWHDMLDMQGRIQLMKMYQKHFPKKKSFKKSVSDLFNNKDPENLNGLSIKTIKDLVAAVYEDAKSKKVVTNDLKQLNHLLCGNLNLDFGNIPLNKKARDYWMKSRVHQLLWDSYIWIHENGINHVSNDEITTGSLML